MLENNFKTAWTILKYHLILSALYYLIILMIYSQKLYWYDFWYHNNWINYLLRLSTRLQPSPIDFALSKVAQVIAWHSNVRVSITYASCLTYLFSFLHWFHNSESWCFLNCILLGTIDIWLCKFELYTADFIILNSLYSMEVFIAKKDAYLVVLVWGAHSWFHNYCSQ
jgi:hypothetical protein